MDPVLINWLQIAGSALVASVIGGAMGGLMALSGLQVRIKHLELGQTEMKDMLNHRVVYRDECTVCKTNADREHNRFERKFDEIKADIKEIKKDIQTLLVRTNVQTHS